jgi:mono/diheme cytochrome c family protein
LIKPKTMNPMNARKYILLLTLLALLPLTRLSAQNWTAPEDAKAKVSSFRFTNETVDKGKLLFQKNCQSCHGIPGQNNPAKIVPSPGDPASEKFQAQKDGEIFWKISNGKTPMPQFMNVLQEEERWDVISYIRSFNPKYVQPEPAAKSGFKGRTVKLSISYLVEKKKICVTALERTKDKKYVAAPGIEIILTVKRYFGDLPVGEPKTTNGKGIALFNAPLDLPADRKGIMELTARVNDPAGNLGDPRVKAVFAMGKPNNAPSLTAQRAWWATRDKAPVWIILVYGSAVIIVWLLIFYILFSLRKIRMLSRG